MSRNWKVRLCSAVLAIPIGLGLGACFELRGGEKKAPDSAEPSKPPPPVELDEENLSYDALMQQATELVDKGHPARSLPRYGSALALRPGDAEALFGRGLARLKLRDATGAIRDLKKALATEPTFADAVYVLAEAHRFSASLAEAKIQYERYLVLDPEGRYADAVRERLLEYPPNAQDTAASQGE